MAETESDSILASMTADGIEPRIVGDAEILMQHSKRRRRHTAAVVARITGAAAEQAFKNLRPSLVGIQRRAIELFHL